MISSCSVNTALGDTQTSRCNCAPLKLEVENRWQVRFCPEAVVCCPLIQHNAKTVEVNLFKRNIFH